MSELNGPRQIVLVTCRHNGKDNIITLAWHMPTSFQPPMYTLSIGKTRFSHDMIKNSGSFCVNFISAEYKDAIVECGTGSGRSKDKFRESGFGREECERIDCPRIKEALGFLECKVVESIETGDHTIFVGEVLKSSPVKPGKRLYHIDGPKMTTTVD